MKNQILTTVSVLAMSISLPAIAADADVNADAGTSVTPGSKAAAEQSTGDVKKDVKNAWKDIKQDTSEAYKNIKATVIGEKQPDGSFTNVVINAHTTATGMIDQPVLNEKGETVAKVHDIILDENGKATMVVVADGEFIGLGKKAAFDYEAVTRVNAEGDVIIPLSEETIDNAAEFSYDNESVGTNVSVMPSTGHSVSKLLGAKLINQNSKAIADIDDIAFKNGQANQLIIGFDKILGLGGEKAALHYSDVEIVKDGQDVRFKLSAKQAAQFENYKKAVTN